MITYLSGKCTGCRSCEVVCALEHEKEFNTRKARIRYTDNWPRTGGVQFCRICEHKDCVAACAPQALIADDQGLVVLNRELCNTCLECSRVCPFGGVPTDGQYPLFCDTCSGRYRCIEWCAAKALLK